MGTAAETTSAKSRGKAPRRVAVQLYAWSEWGRQVIRGAQRFAHDRPGWRLYVEVGHTEHARVLRGGVTLDGILSPLPGSPAAWKRLIREGRTKVVTFTSAVPSALRAVPAVRVNDAKVAEVVGRHLLAGGFRRLAYFALPRPGHGDVRRDALCAFAAAAGVPCDVYRAPGGTSHLLVDAPSLRRWLARLPKPVGIATWSMDMARHAVEACARLGIAVPEQAAVVAWDDDPMLAETLEPTVSAAVLPAERLGYEAARLLDRLFTDPAEPDGPVIIEPSGVLHVRQSSDVSTLADRDVHLAAQYIREHGAGPLKVSAVARALGISRRKLEQDFSRVTGRTPHEAIVQVRLERARQLIVETHWPFDRVAEHSGMGTQQTLRRLLLEHEGITPGEYRARYSAT